MKYPSRTIRQPALAHLFENRPGRKLYGVILHSSRSGIEDGDDGPRTENWSLNPSNNQGGWGSSEDEIIFENGQRVIVNPDPKNKAPTYGAGFSIGPSYQTGWWYWNIEIGQGTLHERFTDAAIESAAERCAQLAEEEGWPYPTERIVYLDQSKPPVYGIGDHQNTGNGRAYGKTDVGPEFPWQRFIDLTNAFRRPVGGDDLPLNQADLQLINTIFDQKLAPLYVRLDEIETKLGSTPAASGTTLTGTFTAKTE